MRSDFFYSKLKEFVKDLADLSGPHNPEDFLNEKLEEANRYGTDFVYAFITDLAQLIRDNSRYFWNERHRQQIQVWFISHGSIINDDIFPEAYNPHADREQELPADFDKKPAFLRVSAETFDNVELSLMRQGYIDADGVWIKDKQDLAALINFLIENDIFGSKDKDNQGRRTKIRKEFEERYKFESVAEQFRPFYIKAMRLSVRQQFVSLLPIIKSIPS